MESVLFLLFLSLFMLLLVTEITICLLRGDTKKIPYCLGSILSSFLVMCCWWKTLTKYCIVILILLFCIYTVFIAVFKIILSRIIHAERFSFDGKVLSNMFLFDLPLLLFHLITLLLNCAKTYCIKQNMIREPSKYGASI